MHRAALPTSGAEMYRACVSTSTPGEHDLPAHALQWSATEASSLRSLLNGRPGMEPPIEELPLLVDCRQI